MELLRLMAVIISLQSSSSPTGAQTAARAGGGGIEVQFVEYKNPKGLLADNKTCGSGGCTFHFKIFFRVGNGTTWEYEYSAKTEDERKFNGQFYSSFGKTAVVNHPLSLNVSGCPEPLWYNVVIKEKSTDVTYLTDNFTGNVLLSKEYLNNWANVSRSRANHKNISLTFKVRHNVSDECFTTVRPTTTTAATTPALQPTSTAGSTSAAPGQAPQPNCAAGSCKNVAIIAAVVSSVATTAIIGAGAAVLYMRKKGNPPK